MGNPLISSIMRRLVIKSQRSTIKMFGADQNLASLIQEDFLLRRFLTANERNHERCFSSLLDLMGSMLCFCRKKETCVPNPPTDDLMHVRGTNLATFRAHAHKVL